MNRINILIFIFFIISLLYASDHISTLDKSNISFIDGEYEAAYVEINNYLDSTGYKHIPDKAYVLGEQIYYFYIRVLIKENETSKIEDVKDKLQRYDRLKSKRIKALLYSDLDALISNNNGDTISGDNYLSNIESLGIDKEYNQDELEFMLRSALLEGQKNSDTLSKVTLLLVIFIFLAMTLIGTALIFVLLIRKRVKNKKSLPPLLLATTDKTKDNLTGLIDECKIYADKIDSVTGRKNNSQNIAEIVYKISKHAGLSQDESLLNYSAALVYDIGLLSIDKTILRSESVSESEYEIIKRHVKIGAQLIPFIPEKYKSTFIDAITKHHENCDGTGYPLGLTKDQIPFLPRVLRVVESYISLISKREYKIICDKESALLHLSREPEKYDQEIVLLLDLVM